VGGAGTLISVLLAGLVLMLATSRDRALRQVADATVALRQDIIHRQTVEAALRRREVELTGFAGVVAHDLRSPLSVAAGYVSILAEEFGDLLDDTGRGYVQRTEAGLARMARLIDDLLDYASAEHTHVNFQPVDLRALVADIIAERTSHLNNDQLPAIDLPALPTVSGDASMLRQVLDNLISNAIKYTPHGRPAQLTINARGIEVPRPGGLSGPPRTGISRASSGSGNWRRTDRRLNLGRRNCPGSPGSMCRRPGAG
jgi:signal transduction histidine kinase